MAYDALRSRTVLFGGSAGSTKLADLWEWNGTAWTNATLPANSWGPEGRSGHAMDYDPRNERILITGGDTANGCASDTWSWSGTEWLLHIPTGTSPAARSGAAMWVDRTTNQVLLFGGACGTTYYNDLWRLDLPVTPRVLTYGQSCAPLSGPTPTLDATPGSIPRLGQSFSVRVSNLPNFLTVAIPFYGFSRTTWNGLPLPLELSTFGMPGCYLQAQVLSNSIAFGFFGYADWSMQIPNISDFAGLNLFFQAFIPLPTAGNSAGGVVTNAARVVLGN